MKLKLAKMSVPELIAAARGDFEIDITEEALKAAGMDEEAFRANVGTKSHDPAPALQALTDRVSKLETAIEALPIVIEAALKAALPQGEPIKPELLASLQAIDGTGLKSDIAALRTDVTTLREQVAQSVATAQAVAVEVDKKIETAVKSGPITPEMQALLNQEKARKDGELTPAASVFARNVAFQ